MRLFNRKLKLLPFTVSLTFLFSVYAFAGDNSFITGSQEVSSATYSEQSLINHPKSSLDEPSGFTSEFDNIRGKAIEQAAESYGSQAGYCMGVHEWNNWAKAHSEVFDKAYDFASLLVDGGRVLPPVILEDTSSYLQKGRSLAITAQTTWHILHYAKIVSVAPVWQDYLIQSCAPPLKPNPVLIPKNSADRVAWREGIEKGWAAGMKAAKQGFSLNLHRMTRDYAGMLRFWLLQKKGVMSAPILSTGTVSMKVDGRTLSVGERIFRLTSNGQFQSPKQWNPVIGFSSANGNSGELSGGVPENASKNVISLDK